MLHRGWAATYMMLPEGDRQMMKVHIAGDVMGAPSLPLVRTAETIEALTEMEYSSIDLQQMARLFGDHPRLAMLFFLIAQEERTILGDRLASVGRRDATERVAGFLIHVAERCSVGLDALVISFDLPLTQQQIGDVLGLTPVHVNRVLRELRMQRLARVEKRRVHLDDIETLRRMAGVPARTIARNLAWLPPSRG